MVVCSSYVSKNRGLDFEFAMSDDKNHKWWRPQFHDQAVAIVKQVLDACTTWSAKPDGIHLDFEPHNAPEVGNWSTFPNKQQYMADMLTVIERIHAVTKRACLRLSVAVAPYYGQTKQSYTITIGGQTKTFRAWLAERADCAILMDYKDSAKEVLLGAQLWLGSNVKETPSEVVIGVETKPDLDDGDTFWQEGSLAMEVALKMVKSDPSIADDSRMAGIAIHEYKYWRVMPLYKE